MEQGNENIEAAEERTICLTGATGRVGGMIKKHFESGGTKVIDIQFKNRDKNLDIIPRHININAIENISSNKITLIHCAAATPDNTYDKSLIYPYNVEMGNSIKMLIENNKAIDSIINLSSMSAFGRITTKVIDEKTISGKCNGYGLSKLHVEKIFRNIAREDSFKKLNIRLPGIITLGMSGNYLSNVMNAMKTENPTNMYTNPDALFNNVCTGKSIADFISILAGEINKKTINIISDIVVIGSAKPIKMYKVLSYLADYYKITDWQDYIKTTNSKDSFIIDTKYAHQLGYPSKTTIEELQQATLEYQ